MTTATATKKEKDVLSTIKNVAGLLRISTEKSDGTGKKVNIEKTLQNHKTKMLDVLQEKQWNFTLYEEVISGGTNYEERPELQRLINEIERYDAIVCMELSRLSRQGLSSQVIKNAVKKKGIKIVTLNPFKVYDLTVPQDAFLYDLSISIGEYEKEVLSLRVKQNKISMAHQGLNSSGSVPFGYFRNPNTKKLEIIEDKAPIVKMIYQWFIDGVGQRTICDRLNEMGIKNNLGNRWVPQSMRYLLTCPTYKGTLVANDYGTEKGKQVIVETVTVENNHPAIISPEMWEKAQAIRNVKKERSGIDKRSRDWNSKKHVSILDGLVYCECCKRKSTIKYYAARNNQFFIIKCTRFDASGKTCENGGIALKDIEKKVFEKLLLHKAKFEEEMKNLKTNNHEERNKALEEQKALYEKELEKLKREMKVIRKLEAAYEMEKEESGLVDEEEEKMIAEDKKENKEQRFAVQAKLDAINEKLGAPAPEVEMQKLQEKLDIIEQLENRTDIEEKEVNLLLKQIILKIDYKRILPANYKSLPKKEREAIKATVEVEYL